MVSFGCFSATTLGDGCCLPTFDDCLINEIITHSVNVTRSPIICLLFSHMTLNSIILIALIFRGRANDF